MTRIVIDRELQQKLMREPMVELVDLQPIDQTQTNPSDLITIAPLNPNYRRC